MIVLVHVIKNMEYISLIVGYINIFGKINTL